MSETRLEYINGKIIEVTPMGYSGRTVADMRYAAAPEYGHAMAAAPELFNAALGAEQIIADFISVHGDGGAGEVLAELRAAIRKAKEESDD